MLLGASNLARGLSTVVRTAQGLTPGPQDFLIATGHGRSYGLPNSMLGRSLPGIVNCQLWNDLERRPPLPTRVLITDIGNDILYGASPERIAAWVETCVERLQRLDARIVMTQLPVGNLPMLSQRRFNFFRRLFFRNRPLALRDVIAAAERLNGLLLKMGQARGFVVTESRPSWYGFDPIHLKFAQWPSAWLEVLRHWRDDDAPLSPTRMSPRAWFYLRSRAPQERSWFGMRRTHGQPTGKLADGSLISVY